MHEESFVTQFFKINTEKKKEKKAQNEKTQVTRKKFLDYLPARTFRNKLFARSNKKQNFLNYLPDHLIKDEIFPKLNQIDLAKLSLSCKRFRALAAPSLKSAQSTYFTLKLSQVFDRLLANYYLDGMFYELLKQINDLISFGANPNPNNILGRSIEKFSEISNDKVSEVYFKLIMSFLKAGATVNQSMLTKSISHPELYSLLNAYQNAMPSPSVGQSAYQQYILQRNFNNFKNGSYGLMHEEIKKALSNGADPNTNNMLNLAIDQYLNLRENKKINDSANSNEHEKVDQAIQFLKLIVLFLDYGAMVDKSLLTKSASCLELQHILSEFYQTKMLSSKTQESSFQTLHLRQEYVSFDYDHDEKRRLARYKRITQILSLGADPNVDNLLADAINRFLNHKELFRLNLQFGNEKSEEEAITQYFLKIVLLFLDHGALVDKASLEKSEGTELYPLLKQSYDKYNPVESFKNRL